MAKPHLINTILYHQSLKNVANLILNQPFLHHNRLYQLLLQKKIKSVIRQYQKIPFSLRIENTNFCNGQCFMCPYPNMKRQKGTMNRQLYQKIINQAEKLNIIYINLHNFGEPLIDKDFIWKVKYAKKHHISRISTNTNGSLLTQSLSQKIISSGLDELYISLDAATQTTYQKIRIGLPYQKVIKNLKYLIKLKKKLKSDKPKIILDFLKFDLNHQETSKFIQKWSKQVDHVCISQIHDWANQKKLNTGMSFQNYVEFSHTPCRLPFTEMLINWDGTVSLCCQDIDGQVILGNLNQQSLTHIWQNKKYQNIRQSHLNLQTQKLKLCQNCKLRTFWWSF